MFEITRRDPFDLTCMCDLIQSMTDDPVFRLSSFRETDGGGLAVDVAEEDGDVVVRASLPGFKKEDIHVQIHDGVLSIRAEHRDEKETKVERFYRRERRVGSVSRRIALPGVVTEATAKARLDNGVLTLRLPLAEAARPKQIPIS